MSVLERFWMWAGIDPDEYAQFGMTRCNGKEEFDFPEYDELLCYVRRLIDKKTRVHHEVEDIVIGLALDNETEDILDYLSKECGDDEILVIVKEAISSIQPHARWQIAELIGRRQPIGCRKYLYDLCNDSDPYVRQRAVNAMRQLDS